MIAALIISQVIVSLPFGWVQYCIETKDPGCISETPITPTDLAYVNKAVVEAMTPKDNADLRDPWKVLDLNGDCEDHVVTVRQALLAFGIDPKAMHFEGGLITEADGHQSKHIVLVVTLDGKDWVLDMKTPDILYQPNDRPYPWTPLTREGRGVLWEQGDTNGAANG